ncbi:MAG: hypothetical protein AB7G23_20520 [Vicinamibacterales bacterium]
MWDHTVGRVEQYRTIHNVTSDHEPIGARPPRSHANYPHWASVAAEVGVTARQLGCEHDLDLHVRHHLGLDHDHTLGHGASR